MKNLLVCFTVLFLISCTSDDELSNTLNINLNLERVVDNMDPYTLSDFKYALYETKEDYINEVNPIDSGSFDATGTLTITENLVFKKYYIDIYTDDKFLSNWYPSDLDVDGSNIIISPDSRNNVPFDEIYIYNHRRMVGEWEFLYYDFVNTNLPERATPQRLTIRKDFTATSYETFENIDFNLQLDFSVEPVQLVSITPSQDSYPNPNTGSGLDMYFYMDDVDNDLLGFRNYTGDDVMYGRN
ncbi:hypothetical protein [Dokdonia sp. Hel_I_53]|uniref:hypothetical protein n=1 Tax=Dokdonia sp. Hel_I_53 TaxID=1566287 RepID=UPI001199ADC5|nr:hypothetical protein [Dokdonia sp. Hel_I_53]TVZ51398.1 hypothetical protein OD90_0539 [Dokdonia sp. Hel_I_53]